MNRPVEQNGEYKIRHTNKVKCFPDMVPEKFIWEKNYLQQILIKWDIHAFKKKCQSLSHIIQKLFQYQ